MSSDIVWHARLRMWLQRHEPLRGLARIRVWHIAVAGVVAAALGVGALVVTSGGASPSGETATRPAPAADLTPQPGEEPQTTYERVRHAFGPWTMMTSEEEIPGNVLILLRQSGAIDASAKRITFVPTEWHDDAPRGLRVAVSNGHVTVGLSKDVEFTVRFNQPFIFEQDPSHAYLVDADGSVWSCSVAELRTEPAEAGS